MKKLLIVNEGYQITGLTRSLYTYIIVVREAGDFYYISCPANKWYLLNTTFAAESLSGHIQWFLEPSSLLTEKV